MSDENIPPRVPLGRRVYRRRKKWQGATWTPAQSSALYGDGEWCPECRVRHGYKTMGLNFEKKSNPEPGEYKFRTLWSCPKTGTVIAQWD